MDFGISPLAQFTNTLIFFFLFSFFFFTEVRDKGPVLKINENKIKSKGYDEPSANLSDASEQMDLTFPQLR